MTCVPAWVRQALRIEWGRRKVVLLDREMASSRLAFPDLLRHLGIDPDQPYSQVHVPQLGCHLYCQPPLDSPCAAEGQ